MTKFIFLTGGVISGVGKGVTTASLGKILKEYGYKVALIKVDPYMNFDAGTLRPTEHGEVWVTYDGGEIDQDLGVYERFLNVGLSKKNNITSGQIFKSVIERERSGGYLGKTVQFIPHIPEEIIKRIRNATYGYEIAIIEIGGTIGDYENIPFLFAAKKLEREIGTHNVAYVLVTYLPIPKTVNEMKTKPTQQAIKQLREEGIFPDFIICRAEREIDDIRKKKIDASVHITIENIISAPDLETIYEVPLYLEKEELGRKLLKRIELEPKTPCNLSSWKKLVNHIKKPKQSINIAVIGKYIQIGDYNISDSYLSVSEALIHAGAELDTGINFCWINAEDIEKDKTVLKKLDDVAGVIVPGGFGQAGSEGKIQTIEYVRKNNINYLGLCYGFQMAVIEFARNACGLKDANTTENNKDTPYPVIDLLPEQKTILESSTYGGTMRLGEYPAIIKSETKVLELYESTNRIQKDKPIVENFAKQEKILFERDQKIVSERHRHRYEVNPQFVQTLEKNGLVFSAYYPRLDGTILMEIVELLDHPFFIATQAHPEFKSRFGNPSPLFYGFVKACLKP